MPSAIFDIIGYNSQKGSKLVKSSRNLQKQQTLNQKSKLKHKEQIYLPCQGRRRLSSNSF
jgi:hypothetical protein